MKTKKHLILLFVFGSLVCYSQKRNIRAIGLNSELKNIKCDFPSYDSSGNIHYTGELYIENPISNTESIEIPLQSFNVSDVNNGNITNATQIASPPTPPFPGVLISLPIVLQPGGGQTIYVEFSRPIAETQTAFHLNYHEIGFPNLLTEEIATESLPNCICNCKEDWTFNDTEHKLNKVNVQGFPFNFQVAQSLKIVGGSPIIEVKVEVISIQHTANDPQCYTCTKQENKMGLFSFVPGFMQPRISGVIAQNDWVNSANAIKGEDMNNDGYSNQAIWRAQDPSVGVDFNLVKRFILPISLPDSSVLECCENKYKVCVRYTFTDVNCMTCTYEQCYISDDENIPIIINNPNTGQGTTKSNVKFKKN